MRIYDSFKNKNFFFILRNRVGFKNINMSNKFNILKYVFGDFWILFVIMLLILKMVYINFS